MAFDFFVANDNLVFLGKITPLKNQKTGLVISDAAVTLRIVDTLGNEVAGIAWPITLNPVVGTAGLYCNSVDKAVAVLKDVSFVAEITALVTGAIDGFWRIPFIARERNE